jgi:hypothetical protein
MLEGAEALRPDLTDGISAYRHFLEGGGKTRLFNYDRYASADAAGRVTLKNAILDFQYAAVELALNRPDLPHGFQMSGPAIRCGADPNMSPRNAIQFPYPATENWQKAIGAHWIWLSGSVEIVTNPETGRPSTFRAIMDLHAEDRYNFNPGDKDVATGVEDDQNGRFEVTGLGHAYQSQATLRRVFSWSGLQLGANLDASQSSPLGRQPDNNRRARNR